MRQIEIDRPNNIVWIKFKAYGSEWDSILAFVKTLDDREFIKELKAWKAPATEKTIEALKKAGFKTIGQPDPEPISIPQDEGWKQIQIDKSQFPELRPYQIDGLKFIKYREGKGLIGDEMGLGKTVQALSYLKLNPDKRPVLIVCPATIKIQWQKEFKRWTGEDNVRILRGKTTYKLDPNSSYIINWDILSWTRKEIMKDTEGNIQYSNKVDDKGKKIPEYNIFIDGWELELKKIPFHVIIGDEFQNIGNPKALRTKAFTKLCKLSDQFVGLSGTPIRSRPDQFFTALSLVDPKVFNNRWRFYEKYCDLKNTPWGWQHKGATNIEELHQLVSNVMIRRKKSEVLKDLPDKIRTVIPLDISGAKKEKEKWDRVKNTRYENNIERKKAIEELKYSAFDLKKDMVVKWIEEFIDSGEKLVVYAYHRSVIDFLYEKFKKISVRMYGGTSEKDREKAKQRFIVDDNYKLFIGNIVAILGVDGLQQVCSNAAFIEIIWTPTDHDQAEDRLHRFGQKDCVNIYYLIAPETVEDDLIKVLDRKLEVIKGIVDGDKPGEMDLLKELMERSEK